MMKDENPICIPYVRQVEYLLATSPWREIHPDDALIFKQFTTLTHVQLDDLDSGKPLKKPRLWLRKDWLTEEKRVRNLKIHSALVRQAATKQKENIERIKKHFQRRFWLPENLAQDAAIKVATELGGIEELGIEFEPLTEEEKKALGPVNYMYKI